MEAPNAGFYGLLSVTGAPVSGGKHGWLWLLVRQQVRHRMRLYTLLLVPFAFLLVVLSLPWLLLAMGEAMAGNDAAFDRWVDRAPLSRWLDRK